MKRPRQKTYPLMRTPIHTLTNLSRETGVELLIKRDDLNGFGFGGNKLRKLAYLVEEAKDKGATVLLTYGGVQTNHGRMTAAVAASEGLKCCIVLMGEEPEERTGNLVLDGMFDAQLVYVGADESLEQVTREVMDRYEASGEQVYEIPLGGSNSLGVLGYFDAALEIQEQLQRPVDYLVHAYGSGGTYGGLYLGSRVLSNPFEVMGMNVLYPPSERQKLIDSLMPVLREANERFELGVQIRESDFNITMDTVMEGYNLPDKRTQSTVLRVARKEGIVLDYCYTGKAFSGMLQKIETGEIPKGSRVLFLHTGGSPGIFSEGHLEAMKPRFSGGGSK
ncbi:MAG: hypothetical protein AVO33_03350 [delta proteobacterium ML8_F1]|nr:MAG: hypothetical protein AVO33_03350 [delta proteobacterium ML8_F1]